MKIKKIINLCKASNTILLYNDEENDVQYLSNGHGIYMFSIKPPITTATVCILNDIDDKKQADMYIETESIKDLEKINVSDSIATDLSAELADIAIVSSGVTLAPFYSEIGILLIDKSYLSPFSSKEELTYCIRTTPTGQPYLCVMKGLLFCAAIMPMTIAKTLITDIEKLQGELICGYELQKQNEEKRLASFKTSESDIDIFDNEIK